MDIIIQKWLFLLKIQFLTRHTELNVKCLCVSDWRGYVFYKDIIYDYETESFYDLNKFYYVDNGVDESPYGFPENIFFQNFRKIEDVRDDKLEIILKK